ncbi:putative ferric-chelate reductase 1 [Boleophthalmus pectinirostris]|uniref:putative ferric-chelate reductase 1 n=1 Tax=Boleophthalmus pectinirostris TaxID=150288 RepID=UPI00242E182D|nr:putative ferric-chelate reductase 1 [Boleophthalmus pectinirostris]
MVRESFLVWLTAAVLFLWAVKKVGGVSISRSGCGQSKLCIEEPKFCDPSSCSGSCLFSSIESTSTSIRFSLSGKAEGFVVLELKSSTKFQSIMFICGRNGSEVFLQVDPPRAPLTAQQMFQADFSGEVKGSVIRCTFRFPLSDITRLNTNNDAVFSVELGTGRVIAPLGPVNVVMRTGFLDVTEPKAYGRAACPSALLSALILPVLITVALMK